MRSFWSAPIGMTGIWKSIRLASWLVVAATATSASGKVVPNDLVAGWSDFTARQDLLLVAETSKRRAKKGDFDDLGEVACAQEVGETLGTCKAAVARSEGEDVTVVVTFPNGFARQLYFSEGAFVSASATMSGAGRDTDWNLENGLFRIRVDDQRYEISEPFVRGE